MLRYKSWLRLTIERLAWSVPMLLGLADEAQSCETRLNGKYRHSGEVKVGRVELDSRLELYSAELRARATLRGLAYFWYNWRITTMMVFVGSCWIVQMIWVVCLGLGCLARNGFFRVEPHEMDVAVAPVVVAEKKRVVEEESDDESIEGVIPRAGEVLNKAQSELRRRKNKQHEEEQPHQHQQEQ